MTATSTAHLKHIIKVTTALDYFGSRHWIILDHVIHLICSRWIIKYMFRAIRTNKCEIPFSTFSFVALLTKSK